MKGSPTVVLLGLSPTEGEGGRAPASRPGYTEQVIQKPPKEF